MQKRTLHSTGQFYKGNLHTHTTLSDGQFTPEDAVKWYRDTLGHDFLALTDHGRFVRHDDLSTEDFLLLPGIELNTIPCEADHPDHHVVGIGVDSRLTMEDGATYSHEWASQQTCQSLIDELTAKGCLTIFAHPHWSTSSTEEGKTLRGVTGMEIMNYGCYAGFHNGLAEAHYDAALWANNFMWAFATDDLHTYNRHWCGGSIVVKADALTNEAITSAIADGSFYATTGPEIYDFYVEDGMIHLTCSPAERIILHGVVPYGTVFAEDEPVTEIHRPVVESDWRRWKDAPPPYVRATVEDAYGRTAWTQPIIL